MNISFVNNRSHRFNDRLFVALFCRNLLLMASSNGTEIGILGTTESGETPLWKQYTFVCTIFRFHLIEVFLENHFQH